PKAVVQSLVESLLVNSKVPRHVACSMRILPPYMYQPDNYCLSGSRHCLHKILIRRPWRWPEMPFKSLNARLSAGEPKEASLCLHRARVRSSFALHLTLGFGNSHGWTGQARRLEKLMINQRPGSVLPFRGTDAMSP